MQYIIKYTAYNIYYKSFENSICSKNSFMGCEKVAFPWCILLYPQMVYGDLHLFGHFCYFVDLRSFLVKRSFLVISGLFYINVFYIM